MGQPNEHLDRPLVLVGGGGHGAVVTEAALQSGRAVAGFLDDAPRAALANACPHLGVLDLLDVDLRGDLPSHAVFLLCFGDLDLRRCVAPSIDDRVADPVIHPGAIVAPSASIAAGAFVGPGAVVHTRARIAAHAIVNSGAIVEHDCHISENAHVAPGAVLGGGARIGAGALVGLRACVLPGVDVGRRATVGAGSVVREAVPESATVVGAPARIIVAA